MKKKLFVFCCFWVMCQFYLAAQPKPPGAPVPIDGGLGVFVVAGAFYGLKKWKEREKR
jgi:hypothetical protein